MIALDARLRSPAAHGWKIRERCPCCFLEWRRASFLVSFFVQMHKLLVLAVSMFASIVPAASETPLNTLTTEEVAAGWKLLFDGKTTTGWRALGKKTFPSTGWTVEDGALRHTKGGGDIVTVEDFENFEFSWEWNIAERGNSGVKYNLPDPHQNIGFEFQLLDDLRHPDGVRGKTVRCGL